ncbi:MAG: hypothetical protein H0S79_17270, partial [Anaerolineaceae bacterium]|nr:hypothetical protein [Anaerolineaceae bacterium]
MKRIQKALLSTFILIVLLTPIVIPGYAQSATNTIVVANTNNDGPGSLRYALLAAQSGTRIEFDPEVFPLDDPQVIYITEELPAITQGKVVIDASNTGVILDGSRLDVASRVWFDNFEFRINDEIIFSSSFDQDIGNWKTSEPDSMVEALAWSPDSVDETGGSLEVDAPPDGNKTIYYYEEQAGLSWWDMLLPDSPVWAMVSPGDRATFEYDYRGFDHVAFFQGYSESAGGPLDMEAVTSWETEDWRHVALSQLVPSGTSMLFPAFRVENYHHGAALQVSSNGNEIYGLAFRDFHYGVVLGGDDNVFGEVSEEPITEVCTGGCNRIESAVLGVECLGSGNLIAGNWIGLTAAGELGDVTHGVGIYGGSYRMDNELVGNWILPRVDGVSLHQQDGLVIRDNWIGPSLDNSDYYYLEGIKFDEGTNGVVIGPNNTLFNSEVSNIVIFNETIENTEIFENQIIGNQDCGILVGDANETNVHDNWFGVLRDGTAYPNFNDFCFNDTSNMTVGPGNQFSYSAATAISYGDASGAQITANNFYKNNFGAIDLWGPVGDEPNQPVIIAVSTATLTVVGKTSPDAIVEIYYSEKSEGGDYVFTCQSNATGKFYCTIPKDLFRTDVKVAALARFEDGGTSTFSEPFFVPTPDFTSLTGITGPLSVSTDPQVIGMSIAIAGLLLFSFNGLAEISSRLIDDLSDDIQEGTGKKQTLIQKLTIINTRGKSWIFYLGWVSILVLIAFAQSMLESHPLFSKQQIELTLLLLGVSAILSLVEVGTEWIARKRWKVACQFCSEINFRGLFFVIGSVALSRVLGFSPGVIVGMAGVVFLTPDLSDKRRGPASFWVLLAIFLVSMAAWGLSVLFMETSPIMETMMLTLFFLGVQSVFFGLIPFG